LTRGLNIQLIFKENYKMSRVSEALENLEELTDSEVLDLIYDWSEELTEYEIMTNPILNGLLNILEENKT